MFYIGGKSYIQTLKKFTNLQIWPLLMDFFLHVKSICCRYQNCCKTFTNILGVSSVFQHNENLTRWQKAASRTSHPLSRCQVVLIKKNFWPETGCFLRFVSFIRTVFSDLLPFKSLNFVTIWVFRFSHNLGFQALSHFQLFSGVACFFLSHLNFVKFEFEWSNFEFLSL